MLLGINEVIRLSDAIARNVDGRLRVVGVTSADADAGRAELLVTVRGCHEGACSLIVNVRRDESVALERDLREKLRTNLTTHLRE